MILWCRSLLLACILVSGLAHAQSDQDEADASRIPSRPQGQVLDQARWFSLEERDAAENELSKLFTENSIDVYLVTVEELPPQGAETFARALGEAWSRSPVWCVVLKIPGDPEEFYVEAGGVKMNRGLIDQTLKEAIRRAKRENTEKERVMSAWRECSEGLRFIHGAQMRNTEKRVDATQKYHAQQKKIRLLRRIYIAGGVIGFLALLALVILVVWWIRAKRTIYTFPETSWRTRFKAPHSGGSGIVVSYHRKKLK